MAFRDQRVEEATVRSAERRADLQAGRTSIAACNTAAITKKLTTSAGSQLGQKMKTTATSATTAIWCLGASDAPTSLPVEAGSPTATRHRPARRPSLVNNQIEPTASNVMTMTV
ncbi:hypothetical protein, partial [Ilumatobacter sp.]|uniref:hypothetical protein n=1 Tax=Ilumatobacter sp. TaxID=1967498 RepID=UPI003AF8456B